MSSQIILPLKGKWGNLKIILHSELLPNKFTVNFIMLTLQARTKGENITTNTQKITEASHSDTKKTIRER